MLRVCLALVLFNVAVQLPTITSAQTILKMKLGEGMRFRAEQTTQSDLAWTSQVDGAPAKLETKVAQTTVGTHRYRERDANGTC